MFGDHIFKFLIFIVQFKKCPVEIKISVIQMKIPFNTINYFCKTNFKVHNILSIDILTTTKLLIQILN